MHWGLDGARKGWVLARLNREQKSGADVWFCSELKDVLASTQAHTVAVDMPIGLATAESPVRVWDQNARRLLPGRLASRVFTPPIQEVLQCEDYASANALQRSLCGRGLSVQSWNIAPKIRELSELLKTHTRLQSLWKEVHPELAFACLNGGIPIVESKKTHVGSSRRIELLNQSARVDFEPLWQSLCERYGRRCFVKDDVFDALALAAAPRLFNET